MKETITLNKWINLEHYYCIESNTKIEGVVKDANHVPDTKAWLNFLQHFNSEGFNAWDLDHNGKVNTADLNLALAGFNTLPEIDPKGLPLELFELKNTFGEGNNFFKPVKDKEDEAIFNGEKISTVIFKTTPADEDNPFVQVNPNSFRLEILGSQNVYKYSFINHNYLG